jgi:hypothetical protein
MDLPAGSWSHSARQRRLTARPRMGLRQRPNCARSLVGREAAPAVWLATWRWWAPGRESCPCATGRRPVGRIPRLGRVEIRLDPAWMRYRETATPETGSPSAFHRPVMVPCRHRDRSSRLRVMLPRCRPPRRCPPTAMPTAPISPARVRLPLRAPRFSVVGAVPVRPAAGSGIHPCVLLGPAVPHRVADSWLPPPFTTTTRRRVGPGSAGRARPTLELAPDANPTPGRTVDLPPLRPQNAESQAGAGQ